MSTLGKFETEVAKLKRWDKKRETEFHSQKLSVEKITGGETGQPGHYGINSAERVRETAHSPAALESFCQCVSCFQKVHTCRDDNKWLQALVIQAHSGLSLCLGENKWDSLAPCEMESSVTRTKVNTSYYILISGFCNIFLMLLLPFAL